jgi:hypothetical protein
MSFAQTLCLAGTALVLPVVATAGTSVEADLAVGVSVVPSVFGPGSRGTVALTLHNLGPGSGDPDMGVFANWVFQRGFRLEVPSDRPPYEIRGPVSGCSIVEEIVGPFVDLSFGLVWTYYFQVLQPGESRTCTFQIEFYPRAFDSFDTHWRTATSPTDPNPENNRVDYRFVFGAPYTEPIPVPATNWQGLSLLLVGMGGLAFAQRRQVLRSAPVRVSAE